MKAEGQGRIGQRTRPTDDLGYEQTALSKLATLFRGS